MSSHADPTKLLSRVLPLVEGSRLLLLGPGEAGCSRIAFPGREAELIVVQHAEAGPWFDEGEQGATVRCDFGFLPEAVEPPFDLAAVWLPKGRAALELQLAAAARVIAPGGGLVLCGPKRGGIKSARAAVADLFGPVLETEAGAHCQAIVSRLERLPALDEDERRVEVEAMGRSFSFVTLPGVFSHGRLDEGTAFLLERLEAGSFKRALDWGCGGGVIGAALQLARPEAEVRLVDSSAAAVEAARRSLTALELDPEAVRPADGWRGIDGDFDLIVTNPPFHQGVDTDRRATEGFLDGARERLGKGGRLLVVANAFLPWSERLAGRFAQVETVARDRRWQLIEARA
jgi:16S rRNA (guanine1207-N2)-methyltransferase